MLLLSYAMFPSPSLSLSHTHTQSVYLALSQQLTLSSSLALLSSTQLMLSSHLSFSLLLSVCMRACGSCVYLCVCVCDQTTPLCCLVNGAQRERRVPLPLPLFFQHIIALFGWCSQWCHTVYGLSPYLLHDYCASVWQVVLRACVISFHLCACDSADCKQLIVNTK